MIALSARKERQRKKETMEIDLSIERVFTALQRRIGVLKRRR